MLRLRLFYGLLTIILLLWSVGACALLLLRDSQKRFDNELRMNYKVIDASQTIRTLTATVNTTYVPILAGTHSTQVPDRMIFDQSKAGLEKKIDTIHKYANDDSRWRSVISRLDPVFANYFGCYETYFAGTAATPEDRQDLIQLISIQTQRLTDLTENLMTLGEEKMFSRKGGLEESSNKNILFVSTLVLLGTFVAVIIYFQLMHHLVDPVSTLERSIDEISRGNFELTLSQPRPGSEFSKVISAFNDMALELKIRRGESEENLHRANLVNAAILEAIPSPVFILGDDSRIIQINPAAESLTERLGVSGRLPLKINNILEECRQTNAHFLPEDPREALLFRIDEQEYYYLPRIFRYNSETSPHSGWAVLLQNVSHIRWLDDIKTNLLSTVSHEIKTPLTGIRMVLHLLLEERSSKLDEVQKVMVTSANEDCERLLVTLNTLLDLSRAESGTTHLDRIPTSIEQSVQRAVRFHGAIAGAQQVNLSVDLPQPPPPEILADPIRLDEVLNNLVSNAIKHSPNGGKVTLRVSQPDADFLRVSIIDQGPGVPLKSQSRIFERFYRAPGQAAEGVGLGLFISREIIRAHEGRIGLRERKENQTEFFIDVPIA